VVVDLVVVAKTESEDLSVVTEGILLIGVDCVSEPVWPVCDVVVLVALSLELELLEADVILVDVSKPEALSTVTDKDFLTDPVSVTDPLRIVCDDVVLAALLVELELLDTDAIRVADTESVDLSVVTEDVFVMVWTF